MPCSYVISTRIGCDQLTTKPGGQAGRRLSRYENLMQKNLSRKHRKDRTINISKALSKVSCKKFPPDSVGEARHSSSFKQARLYLKSFISHLETVWASCCHVLWTVQRSWAGVKLRQNRPEPCCGERRDQLTLQNPHSTPVRAALSATREDLQTLLNHLKLLLLILTTSGLTKSELGSSITD